MLRNRNSSYKKLRFPTYPLSLMMGLSGFFSVIPTLQKDLVLNGFYQQPFHAAAYQKKDAAIITLTDLEGRRNQEMKYVFVT